MLFATSVGRLPIKIVLSSRCSLVSSGGTYFALFFGVLSFFLDVLAANDSCCGGAVLSSSSPEPPSQLGGDDCSLTWFFAFALLLDRAKYPSSRSSCTRSFAESGSETMAKDLRLFFVSARTDASGSCAGPSASKNFRRFLELESADPVGSVPLRFRTFLGSTSTPAMTFGSKLVGFDFVEGRAGSRECGRVTPAYKDTTQSKLRGQSRRITSVRWI